MDRPKMEKPRQIRIGVFLLAFSCATGMAWALWSVPWHYYAQNPPWTLFMVILFAVIIPAYGSLIFCINKGNNQARIIFSVVLAIGAAYSMNTFFYFRHSSFQTLLMIAHFILRACGIAFLYLPSSNEWFRRARLERDISNARRYGF